MSHDFREWEVRCVDVKVAFHELKVGRELAQEFEGGAVCEVAKAEDLSNLSWGKELFELDISVSATCLVCLYATAGVVVRELQLVVTVVKSLRGKRAKIDAA